MAGIVNPLDGSPFDIGGNQLGEAEASGNAENPTLGQSILGGLEAGASNGLLGPLGGASVATGYHGYQIISGLTVSRLVTIIIGLLLLASGVFLLGRDRIMELVRGKE
jgi:hypothetical protein